MIDYITLKEKPILFNGDMVRAVLAGRKTETRRIMKPQPTCTEVWCNWGNEWATAEDKEDAEVIDEWRCPYGQPGDRLWVREAWGIDPTFELIAGMNFDVLYRSDYPNGISDRHDYGLIKWKPSIHMFRRDSRITLEITEIKVERVQDITPEGALAEGVDRTNTSIPGYALTRFISLWDSINEKCGFSWDSNPWVWVVRFKVVE